ESISRSREAARAGPGGRPKASAAAAKRLARRPVATTTRGPHAEDVARVQLEGHLGRERPGPTLVAARAQPVLTWFAGPATTPPPAHRLVVHPPPPADHHVVHRSLAGCSKPSGRRLGEDAEAHVGHALTDLDVARSHRRRWSGGHDRPRRGHHLYGTQGPA